MLSFSQQAQAALSTVHQVRIMYDELYDLIEKLGGMLSFQQQDQDALSAVRQLSTMRKELQHQIQELGIIYLI